MFGEILNAKKASEQARPMNHIASLTDILRVLRPLPRTCENCHVCTYKCVFRTPPRSGARFCYQLCFCHRYDKIVMMQNDLFRRPCRISSFAIHCLDACWHSVLSSPTLLFHGKPDVPLWHSVLPQGCLTPSSGSLIQPRKASGELSGPLSGERDLPTGARRLTAIFAAVRSVKRSICVAIWWRYTSWRRKNFNVSSPWSVGEHSARRPAHAEWRLSLLPRFALHIL